jgi:hypothetical protein
MFRCLENRNILTNPGSGTVIDWSSFSLQTGHCIKLANVVLKSWLNLK